MNIIGLLFVTGLISSTVVGQEPSQNISKIERFLYDRCRIFSADSSAYDEVKKHFSLFSDYFAAQARLLPDGKKEYCEDEKQNLIGMMGQLAKDLKPCFPKEERYLPNFMYESFTEFMNFVCSKRNVENFFSTQGSDCLTTLRSQQAGQEVGHCFKKLFTRFTSDVLKKEDLCLDLKLAETCFGDTLARHCPDFAGYESLNHGFFKSVRKPCSSDITFGVSLVLLIAAFISTKFFS